MDAHFEITRRKVHIYIGDTKLNVTAPSTIVTALRHDGGPGNNTSDLNTIDRYSKMLRRWKLAIGGGSFPKLGNCT